jgi:hypothetical protein
MIFLSSFEVVRLPRSVVTGLVGLMVVRQPGMGRSGEVPYGGRTALGVDSAPIPGRANVAAGTSDDFPTLAQSRPVRRRSAELRLDQSACTWRSPSPGFDTHGYRPRPSDEFHRPDPSAQALTTAIAAA